MIATWRAYATELRPLSAPIGMALLGAGMVLSGYALNDLDRNENARASRFSDLQTATAYAIQNDFETAMSEQYLFLHSQTLRSGPCQDSKCEALLKAALGVGR